MMAKQKNYTGGLIYSTNPTILQEEITEEQETLIPSKQILKVKLDTKQRAGKVVTIVEGFKGKNEDLEALGKVIKTKCGTGGSVKDGIAMVQGDYKQKVILLLQQAGYIVKS
jgi:translation initiation factor 1